MDRHTDWAGLVDAVAKTAEAVLPLVSPKAATATAAVVTAGEKVIELIDHTKQMVDGTVDVAALDATRAEFEAAVNQHVHETAAKLRG